MGAQWLILVFEVSFLGHQHRRCCVCMMFPEGTITDPILSWHHRSNPLLEPKRVVDGKINWDTLKHVAYYEKNLATTPWGTLSTRRVSARCQTARRLVDLANEVFSKAAFLYVWKPFVGTGTGWLIRIGPVSDQCRMSDLRSPCHSVSIVPCTVHATVSHVRFAESCRIFCGVSCRICGVSFRICTCLDRIIHEN